MRQLYLVTVNSSVCYNGRENKEYGVGQDRTGQDRKVKERVREKIAKEIGIKWRMRGERQVAGYVKECSAGRAS